MILQENENWIFIFNVDFFFWGIRGYDESKDVLCIQFFVKNLVDCVEMLEFRWMDIFYQQVKLCLEWENIWLSVFVNFLIDEQVKVSFIVNLMEGKVIGNDYYCVVCYYFDNDFDL